jgi:hypothetical protein
MDYGGYWTGYQVCDFQKEILQKRIRWLQHFNSYEKGLFVIFAEKVFGLLAYLLLLGAVLALGFYYSYKWFEKNSNKEVNDTKELALYGSLKDLRPLPPTSEKAGGKSRLSSHLPETGLLRLGSQWVFGKRL